MRATIFLMCLLFAACSGGSGGKGPPEGPIACGPADDTVYSGRLSFPIVSEVEPNDDTSMAYGVNMPTPAQPGDRIGVLLGGNVSDVSDAADIFAFTSSRSKQFFFKLCEASCNSGGGNDRNGNPDSLNTSIAYFSVLDAAGNEMMTTQANNPTANYGELCVDGGVITYIAVFANNTMSALQDYTLSAFETL
jgi:hypothetical protein